MMGGEKPKGIVLWMGRFYLSQSESKVGCVSGEVPKRCFSTTRNFLETKDIPLELLALFH